MDQLFKMSYDTSFMNYATNLNDSSARIITKLVSDHLKPKSIVDFGCAQGGWLNNWLKNGVSDIQGVDGAYVDQGALSISPSKFMAADLSQPIDLNRTFDIAQCVEVAEHLPESSAKILVKNLIKHASIVLFSAAPPGQGGRGHINEQPYEYWRDLFAEEGYEIYDWVRPQILEHSDVQPWYRYNIFLFAQSQVELPESIKATHISPQGKILDISPPLYRLHKQLVRLIPGSIQNKISSFLAERNR